METKVCRVETKVTGIKKWAGDLNRDFPKEDVQLTDGYMKGVQHHRYQGNANQNHSDIPSHTCEDGFYQKQLRSAGKDVEK